MFEKVSGAYDSDLETATDGNDEASHTRLGGQGVVKEFFQKCIVSSVILGSRERSIGTCFEIR